MLCVARVVEEFHLFDGRFSPKPVDALHCVGKDRADDHQEIGYKRMKIEAWSREKEKKRRADENVESNLEEIDGDICGGGGKIASANEKFSIGI